MSEDLMVRQCSPTLSGLKTGNLFMAPYTSRAAVQAEIRRLNLLLKAKGLRILPLQYLKQRVQIYVYRPNRLRKDLSDPKAQALLASMGYPVENPDACVTCLARKLRQGGPFPHEIGLFLSYPIEDVLGFMDQTACCKCVGCWKVYGDAEAARKRFSQYKKCARVYYDRWKQGTPIQRLAVAG